MDRFNKDEAARVRWTFDGQEIFKGGIRAMATASDKVITKSGLTKEDIDLLIPHQANLRICLLYTSPSPRDNRTSRMPSSA